MKACLLLTAAMALCASAYAQAPMPRTADGHPDFQATWRNPPAGATLEKGRLGDSLVVSAEEAKALGEAAAARTKSMPQFITQADLPDTMSAAVVRGEYRTRVLIEPPDGKLPYSPEAQKAVDAFFADYTSARAGVLVNNHEERDLSERCITSEGQPPMQFTMGTFGRQIVQTADSLVIYSEYFNETRIIRLGGAFGPEGARSWYGDSVGRWEGDTLVVETRHFRLDQPFHIFVGQKPIMVSPDSKVIERFTRVTPDELDYTFTVVDPEIYVRPWLGEYAFTRSSERLYEMSCHEGNQSVTNVLQGGRMTEWRAAQAAAKAAAKPPKAKKKSGSRRN
ncbi:MAG TPA: hypothetical protein VGO52_27210 [Hyphomonadaceae bacterium]|jgi:hypothetical protein|nr:hypothetical protein [Hyphomonadaceae bacterium]